MPAQPPSSASPAPRAPRHIMLDVLAGLLLVLFLGAVWAGLADGFSWARAPVLVLAAFAAKIFLDITIFRARPPTISATPAARCLIVARVAAAAQAAGTANYLVLDMGAGTGALARALARALPSAQVVGVERSLVPYLCARVMQVLGRAPSLHFVRGDIFMQDCRRADAVYLYLNAPLARRLGEKLWAELKGDALVISHSFELGGPWPAPEILSFGGAEGEQAFVYTRPSQPASTCS